MSVKKYTFYNISGTLIPLLVSLVTVPLYLHLIGPARYGVMSIAWLLLGYFGLFDLGLGAATAQRIAASKHSTPEDRASTFTSAIAINVAAGCIGGLVLYLCGSFLVQLLKIDPALRAEALAGIPLIAACVPLATLGGVLTGALQGRERFIELNITSAVSTVALQLVPIAAIWIFGPRIPIIIAAAFAVRLISLGIFGILCHRELLRRHLSLPAWTRMKELLGFGGWITVSAVLGPFMVITDRMMMGAVLGAVAVTIYTVPFLLAQRTTILPVSLTSALFPRLASSTEMENAKLGRTAALAIMSIMTPAVVGAIFLLEPFLELWIGRSLSSQSAAAGRILLAGWWMNGIAQVPFWQLQARALPRLTAIIHVAELPFYLAALYLLMRFYGTTGAAIAFSARCAIDFVILNFYANKNNGAWTTIIIHASFVGASIIVAHVLTAWTLGWLFASGFIVSISLAAAYIYAPRELKQWVKNTLKVALRHSASSP